MVAPRRGRLRVNDTDSRGVPHGPNCMVAGMSDELLRRGISVQRIVADEKSASGVRIADVPLRDVFKSPEELQIEALEAGIRKLTSHLVQLKAEKAGAFAAAIEMAAKVANDWRSALKPGTEERRMGHIEAGMNIAAQIRTLSPAPGMVMVPVSEVSNG
jgi:hypothetical protein